MFIRTTVAQKCHNTFQIKNTPQSPQHISKLETQFDNCSKHISIFTTHFTLENKTIENTFQYNHTTKIEIEKTFQNTGNTWKHRRTPLLVGKVRLRMRGTTIVKPAIPPKSLLFSQYRLWAVVRKSA